MNNVFQTKTLLKTLCEFHEKVEEIKEMITAEKEVVSEENETGELLNLYERIQNLETFRHFALSKAQNTEYVQDFANYCAMIDQVSEQFNLLMKSIIKKFMIYVSQDSVRVVRILRVVFRQEQNDAEMTKRQQAEKQKQESQASESGEAKKKTGQLVQAYVPRCYFKDIKTQISYYLRKRLDEEMEGEDDHDHERTIEQKLSGIKLVLEHLEYLNENLIPCFPPE